jgi:hypothetical protein
MGSMMGGKSVGNGGRDTKCGWCMAVWGKPVVIVHLENTVISVETLWIACRMYIGTRYGVLAVNSL